MKPTLKEALAARRLLLDGAMGSMIQTYKLSPDVCGGNNDALVLKRPGIIAEIHRRYLEAGADIITTCSFNSQRISQAEYGMEGRIAELNRAAARLAIDEAAKMTALTPDQPRYVLGDVGPTGKMLSMSEDVSNPAARAISFDELEAAFLEQISALMDEGVDGILMETIFDTLNAKAAISAYLKAKGDRDIPLLLSMTVSDNSGRTLSGQTPEAFVTSVMHAQPLCVGMNCGLGAGNMIPYVRRIKATLASYPGVYVSCHPNAGLPDEAGHYSDGPEEMAEFMRPLVEENIANIIGGCCGTTPEHIAALRRLLDENHFYPVSSAAIDNNLHLAGLEAFSYGKEFVTVGERCNVAGSRKFLRLISEGKYDEALDIARTQVSKGAQVVDVNMDDGLLDARAQMRTFLNLLGSDPSVCKVPVMVDSSRFEVIEDGLKCLQGKGIVNSISLKQGEEEFLRQARIVRRLGAAVIVMCFDEQGQATSYERRIAIARRAYKLLTEEAGFPASDIIFDPNVLTIATGISEHDNYARDFIRATQWITENLPGTRVSGGLSNLSFAFRGNNYIREAMHSVFLHHATSAGMGMAIMNPATALPYDAIPEDLRDTLSAVILNTEEGAVERLTAMAQEILEQSNKKTEAKAAKTAFATSKPEDRLTAALIAGTTTTLEADLMEMIGAGKTALEIISGPLMSGMNEVGRRFGEGQMFLPQVVRTARTMKKAVEILDPYMSACSNAAAPGAGKVLLATVKGDVHDIGKNIVGVVMACNGFEVIDLGVMVPTEKIVSEAIGQKVDIVCLSGLITPSLDEMCHVASAMQEAWLRVPLFVGGATTSPVHTAVKLAPLYEGGVFHMKDASRNPVVAMQLLDQEQRNAIFEENLKEQAALRQEQERKAQLLAAKTAEQSIKPEDLRLRCNWEEYKTAAAPFMGRGPVVTLKVEDLIPLIDWKYFYWAWRVKEGSEEAVRLRAEADELLQSLAKDPTFKVVGSQAFYSAKGFIDHIEICPHPTGCPCCDHHISIDTPRQGIILPGGSRREMCLALSDFVAPAGENIGVFACTVRSNNGEQKELLLQTISDRLAEAAAEKLARDLAWSGIRPAVGYPSLPEQKEIFKLAELIDFGALGITLTENGAMYPQSSVCGLYIPNPEAEYFSI